MVAKTRKSPKSSPKKQSQAMRVFPVIVCGVVGALGLIALVVFLTPLDDDELAFEPSATGAETAQVPDEILEPKQPYQRVSRQSLALATEAEEIDVAKLRLELTELAEWLQATFVADPIALHIAAQIYSELQQTKSAESTWQECLKSKPQVAGPYAGMAQIYVASGRDESAVQLLEAAVSREIVSAELMVALGSAYENLGQLEKANEILSNAAVQFPDDGAAQLTLGRVQTQMKDYAGAEESIRRAIELDGESEAALFTLSTALVRQRKTEAAKTIREKIQALRKQVTSDAKQDGFQSIYNTAFLGIAHRVILAAASVAENHNELVEAERLVRRAQRLDPDRLKSYMSLSAIFRAKNDLASALEVHKILLEKQPENPLNAINLASVAMQVGQVELAERALEEAVNRDDSNLMAKTALAKFRFASGEFAACRDLAAEIVGQLPSVESYLLLAAAYDGAGQADAAKAAVDRARQIDPGHPMLKTTANDPAASLQP